MHSILNQLKAHATNRPAEIAISTSSDCVTYAQLEDRVNLLAHYFEALKVHTLAFLLDNSIDWIVTDLAAARAGLNTIPIPGFFTQEQIIHVLNDASADLFCTTSNFAPNAGWQHSPPPNVASSAFFIRPLPAKTPVNAAKITYTSGSTGQPKGVVLGGDTLDAVANSIVEAMSGISITKHLCLLPMATLLENVAGIYAPLIRGVTIVAPSLDDIGLSGASLDIDKFCKVINVEAPDSIILVPQLLTAMVTLAEFGLLKTDSLKMIAVGGGRISQHLLDKADAFGLPVFQGYGLSECCSVLTLNTPEANKSGSVGKPLPHAEIRVNDEGELLARGSVMEGYLGEASATVQWYQTGDLGYIDDEGFVFITGRKKNVFITSFGRNVNPEWVESALTQQAAIAHALIFGEAKDHNLALIWLRFDQTPEQLASAIELANQELPDYAQVHDYIVMPHALEDNLITANGRIKRLAALSTYARTIKQHYEITEGTTSHAVL